MVLYDCGIFIFVYAYMSTQVKSALHIQPIDQDNISDDILLSEAVAMAKAAYGDDITMVLLSTQASWEELAVRPDMKQFIPNPEIQYMSISTLSALKDIFACHNTITVDGFTRTQREPTQRSFYTITDGRILAINPTQESLDKFLS